MKTKEEILFQDEENKFREALREFLVREEAKKVEKDVYKKDFYPRDLYEKFGEKGFLAPVLPVQSQYGGRGRLTYEGIVAEELGAACAPRGLLHSTSSYVYATISRHGNEKQKAMYLPPMKSGEKVGSIVITEEGAGSDVMRMKTRAELKGDKYIINGEKRNITNGSQTDVLLV